MQLFLGLQAPVNAIKLPKENPARISLVFGCMI